MTMNMCSQTPRRKFTTLISGITTKSLTRSSVLALALVGPTSGSAMAQSRTLQEVKAAGVVTCGVTTGTKGFSQANSLGDYSGIDADFCRAVASAIFDDPTAVKFVGLKSAERFDALQSRSIDVLSRNTTWTIDRNTKYGTFVGINYYDGQGFMVSKRSGIRSALELDNKGVCIIEATTTDLNAIDFFSVGNMRYRPVYQENIEAVIETYSKGGCIAITNDRSALAAIRAELKNPDAHLVLPEVISKEPLGPSVPKGDEEWANLVRWSLNCMINAEEMGITSNNVRSIDSSATPALKRLVGLEGDYGQQMGVSNNWCARIIRHIGNYAESYERNVGENTALGLARGVNKLWTDGGLMYAPPIR